MKKRVLLSILSFILAFSNIAPSLYVKAADNENIDFASLEFTAEDTYDGGSFVAQNNEWLFYSDINSGCFTALNKNNQNRFTLANFPAANIVVHGNTLYFTDVSGTTTTTTSLGMGYGETKYGGNLYLIDDINGIANGVSFQNIGYPGCTYCNLKFDETGFYSLITYEDGTTEYVQLDESGQVIGYISTESGETIVNSIEIGGFLYLEIMTDNSDDDKYGGYILCIDRDNGSGRKTAIYGMNMHLVSKRIVFQSTSDFYLYAIEPGNDSAYVISYYPVYNFYVSSDIIYCNGYSQYASLNFVITKDYWFAPFEVTQFVGVNDWKNMLEMMAGGNVWRRRRTPTPTPTDITKPPISKEPSITGIIRDGEGRDIGSGEGTQEPGINNGGQGNGPQNSNGQGSNGSGNNGQGDNNLGNNDQGNNNQGNDVQYGPDYPRDKNGQPIKDPEKEGWIYIPGLGWFLPPGAELDKSPGVDGDDKGPTVFPPDDRITGEKETKLKQRQGEIKKGKESEQKNKPTEKAESKPTEKAEEKPEENIDPNDAVKEVRDMFTWSGNLGENFNGCTYNTTAATQKRFLEIYAPAKNGLSYKTFLGEFDSTFTSYGFNDSQIDGIKNFICDIVKNIFTNKDIKISLQETSEDKKTAIVSVTVSKIFYIPRTEAKTLIDRGDWKLGAGVKGSDDKGTQMYKILMYVFKNVSWEKAAQRTDKFKVTYDETEKHWRMTEADSGKIVGLISDENYSPVNATLSNSSSKQNNQNLFSDNQSGQTGSSAPSGSESNSSNNSSAEPMGSSEPVKKGGGTPVDFSRKKDKLEDPIEPALSKAWQELFSAYANGKMGDLYNTEQKLKNFLNTIKPAERKDLIDSLKYNYDQGLISDQKAYNYLMSILDPGFFQTIGNILAPITNKWGLTKKDPTMVNRAFNMIISNHEKYEPIDY